MKMKRSLIVLSILALSATAAHAQEISQAYLEEIHQGAASSPDEADETAQEHVSVTGMKVASHSDTQFVLETTSQTRWSGNTQLIDVKEVTLQLANSGLNSQAEMTVDQIDGNSMGVNETHYSMNCSKNVISLECETALPNGNSLTLSITLQ
jgi:dihydroxyacid dehydratase/phosphogluconate dehydratase